MIRSDEEYIYIPLHKKPYGVITEGCELDAVEYNNNELCISHQQYNVRFQADVRDGESYNWIFVSPREDNLNAEEILNKIREVNLEEDDEELDDNDELILHPNSLVEQLKRNTSTRQTQIDALRNKLKNG